MSYILEALKKSQQERSRGQVPDLQTLHQSVAVAEQVSPRWPHWLLGGALVMSLLALAFLLGWLRPWSASVPTPVVAPQAPLPDAIQIPEPMPGKNIATTVIAQPQATLQQPVSPVMQADPVMPEVARQDVSPEAVPYIDQLPSLLQQSIPQMQFAGHVYSSNPQQRSVIINGHAMSEGDELMAGLKMLQITPDSVVFDYQGQLFRVAVLHDWSFK